MGEGKPDMQQIEDQILQQMHSITIHQGAAAAKQAKFIIVDSDLPHRTLSTISETPLPTMASGGSGLTGQGAFAAVLPPDGGVSGGRVVGYIWGGMGPARILVEMSCRQAGQ